MFDRIINTPLALYRGSHQRCSIKKGVLKNSQNSQENNVSLKLSFLYKRPVIFKYHPLKRVSGYRLLPAGNYMFKVNNVNTRTRCEICSKLKIKILPLLTLSR